jgi:hypothetical protein
MSDPCPANMDVYFARDGKLLGLYPDDGVFQLLEGHAVVDSDYFWHEGMDDWQPISAKWDTPPVARAECAPGNRAPRG